MSSGRPPIILARLCRALPMSSFAFLPAGPDLAAPVGSCHHGAQPKKAIWPILFPTCRVGAAGVAPGLAHGIPHGLGHLGGQRSGGVVVQVDPPVGAGAGKGCCGAQGGARGRAGPHPSNESHCASSCSVLAPITAVTVTVSLPSPTWHRGLQICVCPWGIRHLPCLGHHNHPSSSRLPHSHGTHQSAPCCLPHSNGTHQSAHWPLPPPHGTDQSANAVSPPPPTYPPRSPGRTAQPAAAIPIGRGPASAQGSRWSPAGGARAPVPICAPPCRGGCHSRSAYARPAAEWAWIAK